MLVLGASCVRKKKFPQPRQLKALRPVREPDVVVETRTQADGEAIQVSMLHRGKVHEDDELGRIVLELADGSTTAVEAIRRTRRDTGASEKEIRERLERLWNRRLVRWKALSDRRASF